MGDSSTEALLTINNVDDNRNDNNNNKETRKKKNKIARSTSHAHDELRSFRSYLRWMCVDHSSAWSTSLSWLVFLLLAFVVPGVSHFVLACDSCDATHERPYDDVVQASLTAVATLSFVSLSAFVRRYGLRRFLFLDKLFVDSETVRNGYTNQLHISLKILSSFVLPCFVLESAYKIWWYASGASEIPFLGNPYLSDAVACTLELFSWLYRTTVIFLVCILFHLICHLQILRLQDFAEVFKVDSDVGAVLSEHLRIRRQLRIISHRYRLFIMWFLIFVTCSQFASLLITTKPGTELNVYSAGELALCSVTLVTGLLILLRSATKITHKAQSITCLATKWHICATLNTFDAAHEGESPVSNGDHSSPSMNNIFEGQSTSDMDETSTDEDEDLDNTKLIPAYAHSSISFQKRQALVTYFENNRAGITVYGFTLDRSTLHAIFGLEMSLVLWLLGKTVTGIA